MVDGNLAQHGEVLDLGLPQGLKGKVSISAVERRRISMQLTGVLEAICSKRVSQDEIGQTVTVTVELTRTSFAFPDRRLLRVYSISC